MQEGMPYYLVVFELEDKVIESVKLDHQAVVLVTIWEIRSSRDKPYAFKV